MTYSASLPLICLTIFAWSSLHFLSPDESIKRKLFNISSGADGDRVSWTVYSIKRTTVCTALKSAFISMLGLCVWVSYILCFLNLQPHKVPHCGCVPSCCSLIEHINIEQYCSLVFIKDIPQLCVLLSRYEWNEIKWHDPCAVVCYILLLFVFHYH